MMSLLLRQTLDGGCGCCAVSRPAVARSAEPAGRPRFVMPPPRRLRLGRATVVGPRDGSLLHGVSIVVDRGRILAVEPDGASRSDPSAQRIDAAGKFVVPGYNDM